MTELETIEPATDVVKVPTEVEKLESRAVRLETNEGGDRLVWHVWGPSTGSPLLLLHGGSGSWTHWIRQIDFLESLRYRVIVPDIPGYGSSGALNLPGGGDADGCVLPVIKGLKTLIGTEKVTIIGFSFGGLLGGLIVGEAPEMVKRLILLGAPAFGIRGKPFSLVKWTHLRTQLERDEAHRANLAILMLANPENIDDLAVALHSHNQARDRMRKRALSRTSVLFEKLSTTSVRIDAIYGERDVLYRGVLDQLSTILHGLPTFKKLYRVPNAGHWVQYEASAVVNGHLANLLAEGSGKPKM
jgi:pimeloyl-ACP methyl ester carboxylesterase